MPTSTVKQLCTPSAVVTSDSLVEQVAQIEDFASVDGREFFRRNYFTAGLELLVKRGFERLAGKSEDGAFYLTQAMGGGKTHSLIAFGLLASDPALRREVAPKVIGGDGFGAAKVVIFNGHQNPETLLWGYIAEKLGKSEVMSPFWRTGAKTPGVDEWVALLGDEPILILLDELPSYLQMAQGEPVGSTTLGELTIGALERLQRSAPMQTRLRRRDEPERRRLSRWFKQAADPNREPHKALRSERAGNNSGAAEYRRSLRDRPQAAV